MSVISNVQTVKNTVAYIFSGGQTDDTGATSLYPLGTGFFVGVPTETEGKLWPYFVTAKHVLRNDSGQYLNEIFVRTNLRNWSPDVGQPGAHTERLKVLDRDGNLLWYTHPNPAVDIALFRGSPKHDVCEIEVIPLTAFVTPEYLQRQGIHEGKELFFPCFTPEIPQARRNNPVIRFGRIALLSSEDYETPDGRVRFHWAECFPFGGNSGSPVFLKSERKSTKASESRERYALFGIMKGHVTAPQHIIQLTSPQMLARQHMGIAVVVPVEYLVEILYSDTLRRQRNEVL